MANEINLAQTYKGIDKPYKAKSKSRCLGSKMGFRKKRSAL